MNNSSDMDPTYASNYLQLHPLKVSDFGTFNMESTKEPSSTASTKQEKEGEFSSELVLSASQGSSISSSQGSVRILEGPVTKEQPMLVNSALDSSFEADPKLIESINQKIDDILKDSNPAFDDMSSTDDSESEREEPNSSLLVNLGGSNNASLFMELPNPTMSEQTPSQPVISSSTRIDALDESQALPKLIESEDPDAWKKDLVDSGLASSSDESPYIDYPYPPYDPSGLQSPSKSQKNSNSLVFIGQTSNEQSKNTDQSGPILNLFNKFTGWLGNLGELGEGAWRVINEDPAIYYL